MKTIRRNAHRKIAAIALTIVKVRFYDQVRGGTVDLTEGITAASAVSSALAYLNDPYYGSKLYDNEDGSYTLHVHSNLYFYLYTQAHLDQAAADKAERDAKFAAERKQRTAITAPTREQRNAATIARTTSIHDLDKPASETRTKIEALDSELRRDDLDGSLRAELATERAELVRPAVTVTRTRMAIGDQISQACTALGIKLGHGWNKGTATFLVNGRDYTAGELADLVLEGGFAANYGGNEVRVNWNCPLVPGQTQENRAGRALMITRELQARFGTATARDLEEVAVSLLDMLHGWAIESAPRPKVDYPSGAAEPDFDVTAVRCVRTGDVWLRRERGWVSGDRWSTWYSLNLIDPMSQGFNIHHEES